MALSSMLSLQWNGYDAQPFRLKMRSNEGGTTTVCNQQSAYPFWFSENSVMYYGVQHVQFYRILFDISRLVNRLIS